MYNLLVQIRVPMRRDFFFYLLVVYFHFSFVGFTSLFLFICGQRHVKRNKKKTHNLAKLQWFVLFVGFFFLVYGFHSIHNSCRTREITDRRQSERLQLRRRWWRRCCRRRRLLRRYFRHSKAKPLLRHDVAVIVNKPPQSNPTVNIHIK